MTAPLFIKFSEMPRFLGVTEGCFKNLSKTESFPKPVMLGLKRTKFYKTAEVTEWANNYLEPENA